MSEDATASAVVSQRQPHEEAPRRGTTVLGLGATYTVHLRLI